MGLLLSFFSLYMGIFQVFALISIGRRILMVTPKQSIASFSTPIMREKSYQILKELLL